MKSGIELMRELLMELLPEDMNLPTGIAGLNLVRREEAFEAKPLLYSPEIVIVAQGRKNLYVGETRYSYDAEHYFVLTIPLPVICEAIIRPGEPLLGLVIKLDPGRIAELLADMEPSPPSGGPTGPGLYEARLGPDLIDACIRLLRALQSENESRVLGPLFLKEVLYRILSGEHGEVLRELNLANRNLAQISRVLGIIHEKYSETLDMQSLAREAGMSISAFHSSFRAVTSSSPLQYLKATRLHRAKELMQQEGEKAYQAAAKVGYESVSQFSREYKRLFGVSPAKDRGFVSAEA